MMKRNENITEKMKREVAIKVLVTGEIKQRLDLLAQEFGLPVSTLVASYIGAKSSQDFRSMRAQQDMMEKMQAGMLEMGEKELEKQMKVQERLFQNVNQKRD